MAFPFHTDPWHQHRRDRKALTLLIAQRQQLPLALADLDATDRLDGEILPAEREGFFLHVQRHRLRVALREARAQGGVEGCEGRHG